MRKLTLVFTQFWLLQCNGVGRGAGGQHFLKHSTSYYMSKKEVLTQFYQSYERDDVDIYRILYSTPIKQLCSVPKFTANLYCIYLIVNLKYILKQMQYRFAVYFVGLHRILNWPDIRPPDIRPICFAGYPVSVRISGLIVKGFHKKTKQLTFFSITFTVFNILL